MIKNNIITGRTLFIMLMFSLGILFHSTVFAEQLARREVLPNGAVLLHAERTAVPIVKVVVAIKAGSILEPPEKAGLSNLTADLLNEGTKKRSSRDISDAIEFVGGSLATSGGFDYVTVGLSVLKKDVEMGFDLLSDIILNPSFSPEELKRRKKIISNSILQQKEEPGLVASKAFLKSVFVNHPYGWPVEGTEESLDSITRQDIVDFHRLFYTPNNTIVSVAGDISRSELVSLIDKYFKTWKPKKISGRSLPPLKIGNSAEVIKIHKNITQATIIIGHLGIKRSNPDYYAVSVMNYILGGGGFASRLMDNIRDDKGLSYDVRSSFSSRRYGGDFDVALQTKNQSANTAIDEIFSEMNRIKAEPVSDRELNDAKSYLIGSLPIRLDSNSKIARFLTAVEYYDLGLDYVEKYKRLISAVSKDDILRVAKEYLNTENFILVVVGDMKSADLKY
jgi:zinc protease